MRVAVVGMGRLGRVMATALAPRHDVRPVGRGGAVPTDVDVAWLCVPDGTLPAVAATLPVDTPVIHSAGALPNESVRTAGSVARFHPLLPFAAGRPPDLQGAAARIDGVGPAERIALELAGDLGLVPIRIDGDPARYHAAAVLAGNHLPALLLDAVALLAAAGVPPDVAAAALHRLARTALDNVAAAGADALTGPATRGDVATEARHTRALKAAGLEELAALYAEGSRSVRRALDRRADH
jgi:predicted short-subunit dehydrogenase-like oxidoreductase (DUF2520 family)